MADGYRVYQFGKDGKVKGKQTKVFCRYCRTLNSAKALACFKCNTMIKTPPSGPQRKARREPEEW